MKRFEVGMMGVVMFFSISEFVIPNSLKGSHREGVKVFFIRRFWRLYPPYWVALLLVLWLDPLYKSDRLLWDFSMLPSLGPWGHGFRQFWTLEIELIFYILIAILFLIFGRLSWRVLLLSYTILVGLNINKLMSTDTTLSYDTILPCLLIMFWGGLCREVLRIDFSRSHWFAPKRGINWGRSTVIGVISGMTMVVVLMSYSAMRGVGRSFELAGVFGVLSFLFWVVFTPVRIAWLTQIGRWTYSTYLFHYLIIVISRPLLDILPVRETTLSYQVFSGMCLLVSFGIGALAYQWLEKLSDRIGKQVSERLSQAI